MDLYDLSSSNPDPSETELLLRGYGLTTAEFYYRIPDHQNVLNTFIWSFLDLAPDFENLLSFIAFWGRELDGPLHSVRFIHRIQISPTEWRHLEGDRIFE